MNMPALKGTSNKHEKSVLPAVARVYSRVDKILSERRHTTKWLYERVGMSKQGWSDMVKSGSIKLEVFYLVCEALRVEPCALLDDEAPASVASEPLPTNDQAPQRYLEQRVDELEKEMRELRLQLKKR